MRSVEGDAKIEALIGHRIGRKPTDGQARVVEGGAVERDTSLRREILK